MCGILGICDFTDGLTTSAVEAAARSLKHRGPDDEGYLIYGIASGAVSEYGGPDSLVRRGPDIRSATLNPPVVVLGHRRLSIIDPTPAGHQPMTYGAARYWIVYNGEVYNYPELRQELTALGHVFATQSDTEVVLASYAEWGPCCVDRFNGMWAFAILDTVQGRLFAARDRFGVKPFYYTWNGGTFAFASEIKALLHLPGVPRRLNAGRSYDYLMWGILGAAEETFFEGIAELPASEYLLLDLGNGRLERNRYYALEDTEKSGKFDPQEFKRHVGRVKDLIEQAARLRLRSDVPVGTCLSGGIDSSAIVGLVANALTREHLPQVGSVVRAFTACYEGAEIDESRFAALVIERTGSEWFRTYPCARELWDDLPRVVYAQDEPFGTTSIYAQYRVMRLAKEHGVKVLLDGQGGDELFAGYASCYPAFFLGLIGEGALGEVIGVWNNLGNAPITRRGLLSGTAEYLGVRFLPNAVRGLAARHLRGEGVYLKPEFLRAHRDRDALIADRASGNLNTLCVRMLTRYTMPLLLRYEDRNSMAWSIEARTPFADDHPLIEYVTRVPGVYKIREGWSKALLREAMRGVVPTEIYRRTDKIGFDTPQRDWLRSLWTMGWEYLKAEDQFLDVPRLERDSHRILEAGSARMVDNLWRLLIFSIWRKVFAL